ELALPGEIPTVVADPELVELAVNRLLQAAIEAAATDSAVRVSIAPHADEVIVSVRTLDAPTSRQLVKRVPLDALISSGTGDSALDLPLIEAVLATPGGRAWAEPAPTGTGIVLATAWPLNPRIAQADPPMTVSPPAPAALSSAAPAAALAVERERRVVLVVEG